MCNQAARLCALWRGAVAPCRQAQRTQSKEDAAWNQIGDSAFVQVHSVCVASRRAFGNQARHSAVAGGGRLHIPVRISCKRR